MQKVVLAKSGPPDRFWQPKVVRGTTFCLQKPVPLCQNQSYLRILCKGFLDLAQGRKNLIFCDRPQGLELVLI